MKKDSFCLVLSGGGAKGVYHIGVWRALRELGIKLDAFIGNSIGAVIAGFMAQGLYDELEEIGQKIGIDFIIKVPEALVEKGELKVDRKHIRNFRSFYNHVVSKKGLDTSPLRELLTRYIDEEIIRKSNVDLGVVTINLSQMKPREVFIEEMEENSLINYLLASSAFPGFTSPEIAGKKYIDGGLYENIPYAMAKDRGYKNIIVVDISGLGVNRRPDIKGTNTIYIKNSIKIGGVLDFNRKFLSSFNKLGYLDTMKTFGKLQGISYFFEEDPQIEKKWKSLLKESMVSDILEKQDVDVAGKTYEQISLGIRNILPRSMRHRLNVLYSLMDCAAQALSLERIEVYTFKDFLDQVEGRKQKEDRRIQFIKNSISSRDIKKLRNRIKILLKKKNAELRKENSYYYSELVKVIFVKPFNKILYASLSELRPELPGASLFFSLLPELKKLK